MHSRRSLGVLMLLFVLAVCFVAKPGITPARPQTAEPYKATLAIRLDQPRWTINRNIYGHFAEHLGRLVYDGLWVGEDSPIKNTRGLRNDVVSALKDLHVPVLRWPGGCFADEYHWRDGIGPRDKRPRRPNASWGGVDSNAFGTHEFLDLCEMLGADAYINGNVGTGTPQETMDWIEYMTSDADSDLANMRRRNGRDKPWKIPYFAVGNETWGCGGHMRPEFYADIYRQYATFIKNHSGNRIQRLASGSHDDNYKWTEVLMAEAARHMDGLSLHYYTLPTSNWDKKGSATQFGEKEWHATLVRTLRMEEFIQRHSAIMDKYDPQKRIGLLVDEWGTWYDREPGRDMGALYQQNSLRDAVVAGVNLHLFQKYGDRVRMANIAQMVNVLQAMILTDKEKMVLTPTYHVFRMFRVHQNATMIPTDLSTPEYRIDNASVPALSVSASRDAQGRLHLSIVNLDPTRAATIDTTMFGGTFNSVNGEMLTAREMNAVNTFENANYVQPATFEGFEKRGAQLSLLVPAKSVVMLEIK
ncbi:MAG TPA: alpha-L-arabinofuranosidase C-terminal domain-containing protein [Pyrinomonadaceae bacterium]|nr:alpha-L-arabinofuranosidase C-terminal domain-containing protein [Pyrinomonadaceae bacterium]